VNHGTERCISFGGLRVDHAVGSEVLRVLKPLDVNAAVKALEAQTGETSAAQRQLDLALQQARFSAARARRQYDAVDCETATNRNPPPKRHKELILPAELVRGWGPKSAPIGTPSSR
jgi:hypothetical protein